MVKWNKGGGTVWQKGGAFGKKGGEFAPSLLTLLVHHCDVTVLQRGRC